MAFTTITQATAAVKKALGFAQTDNAKALGNEQFKTGFSAAAGAILGDSIPSVPGNTSLYELTSGVVELVRLPMVADPSSNGHAYLAQLPAAYQANSSNPNKAKAEFANNARLCDAPGKVQIVPVSFGARYEVIPYSGGDTTKGSGTVIPPADARDWYIDPFNGVFFQQGSGSDSVVSFIECYIWVGPFMTDRLSVMSGNGLSSSSVLAPTNYQSVVIDTYVGTAGLGIAKWFVSCDTATESTTCEVLALMNGTDVAFNTSGILVLGGLPLFKVDVIESSGSLLLKAVASTAGVTIKAKRLTIQ